MAGCVCCLTRRAFVLGTLGTALVAGAARAQSPEPVAETLARGRVDYSDLLGGPAEVLTLRITLPPKTALTWHIHPGPVQGIVTAGELTVYHPDGCKNTYGPGMAVLIDGGALHEDHNDGLVPLEVVSTFLLPEGAPVRVPVVPPVVPDCA